MYIQVDNYICEACETLEIEYNKSKYDKRTEKIVYLRLLLMERNKNRKFFIPENLKLCFLKCCLKNGGNANLVLNTFDYYYNKCR